MKKFSPLLGLLLLYVLACPQLKAQKPDSIIIKAKLQEWHNVIIKTRDGNTTSAYMRVHSQYMPQRRLSVLIKEGSQFADTIMEVENIESIGYFSRRYVKISPDEYKYDLLAEEAQTGILNLYIYIEMEQAPVPIPVPSAVRVLAVPYTEKNYFIAHDFKIVQIKRDKFQKQMLEYVSSNPGLAEKIKNKTYKYKDIEIIVKEFNASVSAN